MADRGARGTVQDWPVRQHSANGQPKPKRSEPTCHRCGAGFFGLWPTRTGKLGIWRSNPFVWFCSVECDTGNTPQNADEGSA